MDKNQPSQSIASRKSDTLLHLEVDEKTVELGLAGTTVEVLATSFQQDTN